MESACSDSSRPPLLTRYKHLVILHPIGQGGFGTVYKAKHAKLRYVAYKQINEKPTVSGNIRLMKEASISHMMDHENIVRMLGMVMEEDNLGLVFEFMANNNLSEYLESNKIEYRHKVHLLADVASGMKYLHSRKPPIIHGDLKMLNVLVSGDLRAKISDFGCSYLKQLTQEFSNNTVRIGTVTHVPPENWRTPHLRKKEEYDIYGFGVLIWEVMTQKRPFAGENAQVVSVHVEKGHRPDVAEIPEEVSWKVRRLMEACWNQDLDKRIEFSKSLDILKKELIGLRSIPTAEVQYIDSIEEWDEKGMNGVNGIAWFEDKIYVLFNFKNSKQIRVYPDQKPFDELIHDRIGIIQLKCAIDMVANSRSRSIFISDRGNRCLWEIQWPGQRVTGWKMKGWPGGMSITSSDKLLVLVVRRKRVYLELCRLMNFQITKSIALPSNIKIVRHAVELSNGNFVISYRNKDSPDVPLLSELSSDGQHIIRTFFPSSMVDPIQLKQWRPVHLATDEDDNIFVADFSSYRPAGGDDRVLLLNPRLTAHQLLLQKDQHRISNPKRLCFVREKNMLLVGQGLTSTPLTSVSVFKVITAKQRMPLFGWGLQKISTLCKNQNQWVG